MKKPHSSEIDQLFEAVAKLGLTANDSPAIRKRIAVKALLKTFTIIVVLSLSGSVILSSGRVAFAAEGAFSNYFSGSYGAGIGSSLILTLFLSHSRQANAQKLE